jgi:hypothetical protein
VLLVDRLAIVVEAKAHMLASSAKGGDVNRLRGNLEDIVGVAAKQIGRFVRTLRNDGVIALRKGNETTEIKSADIDSIFGVIATLEDLGSLGVSTVTLAELGVQIDPDSTPAVFAHHTLEEIVRLLDRPWALLHYLHRRQVMSRRLQVQALEELDIVMYYLRQNLFFDDLIPAGSALEFDIETEPLDAWSYYRRGYRSAKVAKPSQRIPLHLERLLAGLAEARPPSWTRAALRLLDFDDVSRKALGRGLQQARRRIREDRQLHDLTMDSGSQGQDDIWGISIVMGPAGADHLEARTHFLCHLNGLRHGAAEWIGVAVVASGDALKPVAVIVATPPYDQVVPEDQAVMPPQWNGPRQVVHRLAPQPPRDA